MSPPLYFVADVQHTAHTLATIELSPRPLLACDSSALKSQKMATSDTGFSSSVAPVHSERMDITPAGLISSNISRVRGCVVLKNPLRTEAWVRVGDTAARN